MTPLRAFFTISESVLIAMPSATGSAQDAAGFGGPGATSTRHIRQLPATDKAFVITEARNLNAGHLAGLQDGDPGGDFDLGAVNRYVWHRRSPTPRPARA